MADAEVPREVAPSTVRLDLEVPVGVLAALRLDPVMFGRELRVAAAVRWYESGSVSQGRAAEIAALSRAEFIAALARFGVMPFQGGLALILNKSLQIW